MDSQSKNYLHYQQSSFPCECGKTHTMPIQDIVIGNGVINQISELLPENQKVMVVSDQIIMGLLKDKLLGEIEKTAKAEVILDYTLPVSPDENHLFQFLNSYQSDIDSFVAAGSGAVNDITRYFSYKLNKPYLSIPTSPSMDGYSAEVSLLFIGGVKQTYNAIYPKAILADLDIIKTAPFSHIAAGVGDLVAKITATTDWKLSNIINGEYYCEYTTNKLLEIIHDLFDKKQDLVHKSDDVIFTLTNGLMLCGMAMHWVKSSRPAAGAEHHMTHFWGLQENVPHKLHGVECAVATLAILKVYEYLTRLDFKDIDVESLITTRVTKDDWINQISEAFGDKANVIFEQQKGKSFDKAEIRNRINQIKNNASDIKQLLEEKQVYYSQIESVLSELRAPTSPKELGLPEDVFKNSLLWAKELRSKYGILDLAEDIGVLKEIAEQITRKFYL